MDQLYGLGYRGTHTAWRHGKYVFIADEVFPAGPVKGAKDASAFRAYGRLQAIDARGDGPTGAEEEDGGVEALAAPAGAEREP